MKHKQDSSRERELFRFNGGTQDDGGRTVIDKKSNRHRTRRPHPHGEARGHDPGSSPDRLWARRLKRVFRLDITECGQCQEPVKIITCIEDPVVIEKILAYLRAKEGEQGSPRTQLPPTRAPPDRPAPARRGRSVRSGAGNSGNTGSFIEEFVADGVTEQVNNPGFQARISPLGELDNPDYPDYSSII